MEQKELDIIDPAGDIRTAITRMVGARLAAMKALKHLKADMKIKTIEYELPIESLEETIDKCYSLEKELGDAHQSLLVSIATEINAE